jgi:ATP-dependent Zn protease
MSDATGPGRQAGPAGRKDSGGRPPAPFDPQQRRATLAWIIGGLVLLLVFQTTVVERPREITFSRFLALVDEGKVTEVNISDTTITGKFDSGDSEVSFTSTITPNLEVNSLIRELRNKGIEFSGSQPSPSG